MCWDRCSSPPIFAPRVGTGFKLKSDRELRQITSEIRGVNLIFGNLIGENEREDRGGAYRYRSPRKKSDFKQRALTSRSALQRHDGQMTSASVGIDVYVKAIAWLTSDDGPRSRAR